MTTALAIAPAVGMRFRHVGHVDCVVTAVSDTTVEFAQWSDARGGAAGHAWTATPDVFPSLVIRLESAA